MTMDAKTDQILSALVTAQEALADGEETVSMLMHERDQALARARKTGTPVPELMRLTGLSRPAIYKALDRAGLS